MAAIVNFPDGWTLAFPHDSVRDVTEAISQWMRDGVPYVSTVGLFERSDPMTGIALNWSAIGRVEVSLPGADIDLDKPFSWQGVLVTANARWTLRLVFRPPLLRPGSSKAAEEPTDNQDEQASQLERGLKVHLSSPFDGAHQGGRTVVTFQPGLEGQS